MKRVLSLVLGCVFALTLAVGALAEPFYLEEAGVTIEVPEGMTAQDLSSEEAFLVAITVDADQNLKYAFSISFIEEFEGKDIEDLSQEEGDMLMQGFAVAITDPQFSSAETEFLNMLVAASGDGMQHHFVTVMNGWLFDVVVARADGPLTDEEINTAAELMLSLEFDEE